MNDSTHGNVSTNLAETAARPRLTSRRGWFPVSKADVALLNEQCCGAKSGATTKVVWLALLQLQNDRQSSEFQVPIGLIASLAGTGRTATKDGIARLVELGFVAKDLQRIEGKKESDVNFYHLLRGRSVNDRGSVDNQLAGRSDKFSGTRPVLKEASASPYSRSKEAQKKKRFPSNNAPDSLRGFSGSAGAAGVAHGGSGEKKVSRADSWRPKPKVVQP
jgi:hypothetical protein